MPHPSLKMKPERREKLFAAATREFTAHGFEQASLNNIIAEVGMSKSSFYHYFANKTELFEQIFEQALAPLAQIVTSFEPEVLTKENFWPAMLSTAQGSSNLLVEQPHIFMVGRMFHRNLNEPNGICKRMMDMPLALVSRILEHGKMIGVVREDLPTSLLIESAMGLGMAVDRWAVEHVEDYSLDEFNAFQARILDMFVRLMSPEG